MAISSAMQLQLYTLLHLLLCSGLIPSVECFSLHFRTSTTSPITSATSARVARPYINQQTKSLVRFPLHSSYNNNNYINLDNMDDGSIDPDLNTFDEPDDVSDEELLQMSGDWDERIPPFNTIHLSGRMGNTPEPRYFDDGKVVVNLSLAVKRKYHSMERAALNLGSGDEETDWYTLEIWGRTAEFVAKYVDRGARVSVVGTLEVDQWTDQATGEERSKPKVIVRDFDVLETRSEAQARRAARGGGRDYYNNNNGGGGGGDGYGYSPPASTGGFFDT